MRLDDIGKRYADATWAQRLSDLQKTHTADLQRVIEDFADRGLTGSGLEVSAKVKQHAKRIRDLVDARIQSYVEAYEKSGTLMEDYDLGEIVAEISSMTKSGVSQLTNNAELKGLAGHLQSEESSILAEGQRRLRLYVDGKLLESRKVRNYGSLNLHNMFEEHFQHLKRSFSRIDPKVAENIAEAAGRLGEATSESASQSALTCRRALKVFADAVFPPTDKHPSGRCLDDTHYVNRLWQYAADSLEAKEGREHLQSSLETLGKRIDRLNALASKGVHSTFEQQEAQRCLIETIFLLADLAALKDR